MTLLINSCWRFLKVNSNLLSPTLADADFLQQLTSSKSWERDLSLKVQFVRKLISEPHSQLVTYCSFGMAADPTYNLKASVFDELGMRLKNQCYKLDLYSRLVFLAPKMILLFNKKVYLHRDCFRDVVRLSQKQEHQVDVTLIVKVAPKIYAAAI